LLGFQQVFNATGETVCCLVRAKFLAIVVSAFNGEFDRHLHIGPPHSDRGSQYTSEQFQRLMTDHGVVCSMSRSGNVWDNGGAQRRDGVQGILPKIETLSGYPSRKRRNWFLAV
jgi:transposase InsO family protein